MDALVASGLGKVYPGHAGPVHALTDIDLSIRRQQLFAFLGRNGAGKTTFIKIAASLLLPTRGRIELFGHDVARDPRSIRPMIAVVPQEGKPFYHLTPTEHIYEYLRVRGTSAEAAKSRTAEMIEAMGLTNFAHEVAYRLSGGLQQRTLVAMILATEAPFLFLDEPTLGMDPFARRQVWEVIRATVRHGSTVLLTTHYLDEAEQLSEELAVIEGGHVLYRGSPEALKSRVQREVRVLFAPNFPSKELEPFGKVIVDREKVTLLTSRRHVPELTEMALSHGSAVQLGPVTLEEAFLELVGRKIEEEES
jgi:ABC-2 type transport system ATP-binding protein